MNNWQPGQQLKNGKYTIEKTLGKGGFGITFLAKDRRGKSVVLKTINELIQNRPEFDKFRQDFYNEAVQSARCHHPHIVKILRVFEEAGLPYIVMEYILGENLDAKVKNQNPPSEAEALLYIQQIGAALTEVHRQGLLHRDVKPNNIIIRDDGGGAVLIDFGTARDFTPEDPMDTHTAFYTPGYTPPEQYQYQAAQGPYIDVYSLAATLYYLLTKQAPINAITRSNQEQTNGVDPLIHPINIVPNLNPQINNAILIGMALNYRERPQTIEEFLQILPLEYDSNASTLLEQNSPQQSPPLPITVTAHPDYSWLRRVSLALGGVLITGVVLFYFLFPRTQFNSYNFDKENSGTITIKAPKNWESQQSLIEGIKFLPPNDNDSFQGYLVISVEDEAGSLDDYSKKKLSEIQTNLNPYSFDKRETKLSGQPATQVIYSYPENSKVFKKLQVWTIINNRAYIITYKAEEKNYNKYENIIETMIESFAVN